MIPYFTENHESNIKLDLNVEINQNPKPKTLPSDK